MYVGDRLQIKGKCLWSALEGMAETGKRYQQGSDMQFKRNMTDACPPVASQARRPDTQTEVANVIA